MSIFSQLTPHDMNMNMSTMTSNMAAPHAPPATLNQDNIPDDLICSICMTIPVDPVITPCNHVFCKPCISQALTQNSLCPIDRRPCTCRQLKRLDGLSLRIWSGIQVKCGNHESGCAWKGSIADYSAHVENHCSVGRNTTGHNNNSALVEELETLRQDNLDLKKGVKEFAELVIGQNAKIADLQGVILQLEQERDSLQQSRDSLRANIRNNSNLPVLFHGHYNFKRENVVQLSQLISRHLENKPSSIDQNKIFNCVRTCFTDLERDYSDNPAHYYLDVRMLLVTCLASTWFTPNQRNNIDNWYRNHFC